MQDVASEKLDVQQLPVRDDGSADTLFIDGVHGLSVMDGVVVMNLTRTTIPAPGSGDQGPYIDTVLRLNMSVGALVRIQKFLTDNVAKMQRDGIVSIQEEESNVGVRE